MAGRYYSSVHLVKRSTRYTKRVLTHPELGSVPRSMPLIIPNDCSYDISTNELKPIRPDERRSRLKVVPETLRLLETIDRPIAVLAIGGPCRTGKSYFLSRVVGSADDFALGHTMNAKTFGIWIGTTVLENEEFTVLLMDTEGIDSYKANYKNKDDASILVMTVLLSSYFIYNSMGTPKRNDLERMSHFGKLYSSIAAEKDKEDPDVFELRKYFPDLLWLLRDVVLQIPQGMTPTDYLKTQVLKRSRSFTETESDKVGRAILLLFPAIMCMTLSPPTTDPSVLQYMTTYHGQSSLSPQFNEQVESVVEYVLENIRAKNGFAEGKLVDGPLLAAMTEQYTQAVNDPNAIPCISDTWCVVVVARCRKVLDELIREYEDEMKRKIAEVGLPMEEDSQVLDTSGSCTLFGLHRSILLSQTQALKKQIGHYFDGFVYADHSSSTRLTLDSFITELEQSTAVFEEKESLGVSKHQTRQFTQKVVSSGILLKFAQENLKISRSQCQVSFSQLYKEIKAKLKQVHFKSTFQDLSVVQQTLLEQYKKRAVGPAKWEVYEERQDFVELLEDIYTMSCERYTYSQGWEEISRARSHQTSALKSTVVDEDDWADISCYLLKLDKRQITLLGGVLGLSAFNLDKMQNLPEDVVKAWLRKEDNVMAKSGDQLTWSILVEALRRIGQKGIADKMYTEKCTT